MKDFSVYQAFVNFLVSVLIALITSMITLAVERKRKINEIQREIYTAIYKNLNLLKSNPTLIYDEEFFQDIKDLKVEVELYANKNINNDFLAFYKEIEYDFEEYISKFKCEDEGNIEGFPKEIYDELSEIDKTDYILQNLPNYNNICSLIEKLKKNIAKTLRAG
jgi:DNA-directed RNA polymerase